MSVGSSKKPGWSSVKAQLQELDRADLVALIQDLYAASKDNQAFLHARFGLGDDVLKPYKQTIDRWLWPDVFKQQEPSIAKAKKAIADYRKAVGLPGGIADLATYFCERGVGFAVDVGLQDEAYFGALARMFAQALEAAEALADQQRLPIVTRLQAVREAASNVGYGLDEEMGDLLMRHGVDP